MTDPRDGWPSLATALSGVREREVSRKADAPPALSANPSAAEVRARFDELMEYLDRYYDHGAWDAQVVAWFLIQEVISAARAPNGRANHSWRVLAAFQGDDGEGHICNEAGDAYRVSGEQGVLTIADVRAAIAQAPHAHVRLDNLECPECGHHPSWHGENHSDGCIESGCICSLNSRDCYAASIGARAVPPDGETR